MPLDMQHIHLAKLKNSKDKLYHGIPGVFVK